MKWLVAILILAIVLIAGCSQISSIACKPNWIIQSYRINDLPGNPIEICKSECNISFQVTSVKIEDNICYCDAHNCNPNTEGQTQPVTNTPQPETNTSQNVQVFCTGGTLSFATSDYPKVSGNVVTALVQAGSVDLTGFTVETIDNTGHVSSKDAGNSTIKVGSSGTVSASFTGAGLVAGNYARVIAKNCPSIKTDWAKLK